MSGPIPARVDSAAKAVLLGLIDDAINAGWSLGRICGLLELDRARAWRWRVRRLPAVVCVPPGRSADRRSSVASGPSLGGQIVPQLGAAPRWNAMIHERQAVSQTF